jgi:2-polyprenyl-3-methyl-5-hydroxy-6-metoxy-1,4-benzoquinol methylase
MTDATEVRNRPYTTDMAPRGFLQRKTWSQGSYLPRVEALRPYVTDRSVLDVGCSSGNWRDDWVHGQVATMASELVGIDINEPAIAELNERGYDVRFGNAEDFDLGRTFDVVMAGELIEHLENAGGMLRSARRHLKPGGRLILTTPNAFNFSNFVYRLRGMPRVNGDHTCWYCEQTLAQLLRRTGYEVVDMTYLHFESPGKVRGRIAGAARSLLPDRLSWGTLIAIAEPVASEPADDGER